MDEIWITDLMHPTLSLRDSKLDSILRTRNSHELVLVSTHLYILVLLSTADAHTFDYIIDLEKEAAKYDPHGEYVRRWLPMLARLPTQVSCRLSTVCGGCPCWLASPRK